ncbi:hypothetical protein HMPREF0580_0385 [Mobiluncus mulieris ATCC 35239]|uniref:Uncharacterized protein n=1 Tax=Mobiluncus mulieris ATCC 35239 TaxID=871571 RepID=E0QNC1_9ACTO|nr:hypothetical protein HMPREF0580_0385 [Mobiluncus mulieris ATCC 35239]
MSGLPAATRGGLIRVDLGLYPKKHGFARPIIRAALKFYCFLTKILDVTDV